MLEPPNEIEEHKFNLKNNPVWKFFSSIKVAIVLMLLLVALSLIGTFVIQVPMSFSSYSPLGTYLIHLSIILLIFGFIVGSYFGFRNSSFVVAEGNTELVGNGTSLALHLVSFSSEYWPDGTPKNYSSQVAIYDQNQLAKQGTVQVNHPINYNGIRFFQSNFGPAVLLKVINTRGDVIYNGAVPLTEYVNDYPYVRRLGGIYLNQLGCIISLAGRAVNMDDASLNQGQIGLELYTYHSNQPVAASKLTNGVPFTTGDLNVTYSGNAQYSEFQVSRDPGDSLIWIASGIFLVGLVIVFYFPRQRISVMIHAKQDDKQAIYMRSISNRRQVISADLSGLVRELKRHLNLK